MGGPCSGLICIPAVRGGGSEGGWGREGGGGGGREGRREGGGGGSEGGVREG